LLIDADRSPAAVPLRADTMSAIGALDGDALNDLGEYLGCGMYHFSPLREENTEVVVARVAAHRPKNWFRFFGTRRGAPSTVIL
jgi:hypothetical protein